jgi:Ca2+-transporting ATPase
MDAGEVGRLLSVNIEDGLDLTTVEQRLASHGPNELPKAGKTTLFSIIAHQFTSPLIYLLLIAAAIAFALGETKDAVVILSVVFINAVIGALQEGRAERSIESLRQLSSLNARVIRDGREIVIAAKDLVPGDLVIIAAGDAVPADARLVEANGLETSEAALTGESLPVEKSLDVVAHDTGLADRHSMVYAGTHATSGRGRAVIVSTGVHTEIGKLAIQTAEAKEARSPLERRIRQFSHYVAVAAVILFALIVLIGWMRGLPLAQVFMVAISQMVSMVPEGLPIAMTVALAVGVQRMARRGVIIRRLTAVETLGSTTVICTDKTGTLTRNEMTVTCILLASGEVFDVAGVGYAPAGHFNKGERTADPSNEADLTELLKAACLCNDAALQPPDAEDSRWRPVGDPTEVALLTAAAKASLSKEALQETFPRVAEIPFDSAAKLMATEHSYESGRRIYLKGAPEIMVGMCSSYIDCQCAKPLDAEAKDRLLAAANQMASRALRVLAIGVVSDRRLDVDKDFEQLRGSVTLLGLVGQIDPPRDEVRDAVTACRMAGIRPVMITGDHKATGLAIGSSLGIHQPGELIVDGAELNNMSDEALLRSCESTAVYARVHPSQKQRIVEALRQRGQVVAMTGDGVNDAPALASADVGVAMGITGTEVAKQAAKIVITDDNFATIVAGVEEGRLVHRNLKKVVLYLVATSAAEVLILLLAIIAGYPPPLAAVQILWINLVTEGSVTINLILEPLEGDEMTLPPPKPDSRLISHEMLGRMLLMTPTIATVTLGWFAFRLSQDLPFAQVQTETFTLLAVCQWFNVLNCRSSIHSALSFDIFRNHWLIGGLVVSNLLQMAVVYWPPLNALFHTEPIHFQEFLMIGAVGSIVLWTEELRKLMVRIHRKK